MVPGKMDWNYEKQPEIFWLAIYMFNSFAAHALARCWSQIQMFCLRSNIDNHLNLWNFKTISSFDLKT